MTCGGFAVILQPSEEKADGDHATGSATPGDFEVSGVQSWLEIRGSA
jgi:hypothetical protein